MPSKWIEHVKAHAKEKGMKYKDALKCAECKASYKTGSGLTQSSKVTPHFDNINPDYSRPLENADITDVPVTKQIQTKKNYKVHSDLEVNKQIARKQLIPNSGRGIKRKSPWIEHVRTYAKANGIKYSDALKDPACKASYKKTEVVEGGMLKGIRRILGITDAPIAPTEPEPERSRSMIANTTEHSFRSTVMGPQLQPHNHEYRHLNYDRDETLSRSRRELKNYHKIRKRDLEKRDYETNTEDGYISKMNKKQRDLAEAIERRVEEKKGYGKPKPNLVVHSVTY